MKSHHFKSRQNKGLINSINVTPFVDIMLVLLIVFMITSPLLVPGVVVDLPNTVSKPIVSEDKPLVVTVARDQSVYIQDKQILMGDVVKVLNSMVKGNKENRVFIRGDKSVAYGVIVKIIADIKSAGFNKLAVVSDPE